MCIEKIEEDPEENPDKIANVDKLLRTASNKRYKEFQSYIFLSSGIFESTTILSNLLSHLSLES